MIDQVTMNARKPREDEFGDAMLNRMNERHKPLHSWGLEHIRPETARSILDIGFGGGQNIRNLLELAPAASVRGIDYSSASYKKCAQLNAGAIQSGRLEICRGSAEALPYPADSFDLVTAFETVYYWPNIVDCFRSVRKVLQPGGVFLIVNEDSSMEGNEAIAEALSMNIYSRDELGKLLRDAGFEDVKTFGHENGRWICAVARK